MQIRRKLITNIDSAGDIQKPVSPPVKKPAYEANMMKPNSTPNLAMPPMGSGGPGPKTGSSPIPSAPSPKTLAGGPPDSEAQEDSSPQALVQGIHEDLMTLMDMVQKAAPQAAAKLEAVVQGFQMFVQDLVGGAANGSPAPGGPANQPTAGGPGSVPM